MSSNPKDFGEWIEVLKDDGSSISPQIWIKVELTVILVKYVKNIDKRII